MLKWVISAIATLFTMVVIKLAVTKWFGVDWFSFGGEVLGFMLTFAVITVYRLAIEKAAQQSVHPTKGGQA